MLLVFTISVSLYYHAILAHKQLTPSCLLLSVYVLDLSGGRETLILSFSSVGAVNDIAIGSVDSIYIFLHNIIHFE